MRVLHVISSFGRGGAPALIMNYMKELDGKVDFDFLLRSNNNSYSEEIEKCGGKVFIAPSFPRNILKNYLYTRNFIKTHTEYDIIHIHCNALIYIIPALIAKGNGRKVIIHSHNTKSESVLGGIVHRINRLFVKQYSDIRLACSNLAGEWLFKKDYTLLKNAVFADNFRHNEKGRQYIRNKLNINEKTVYLHVGRFEKQKNHDFLIDIFDELYKRNHNSVLLLLGAGSLQESIKSKVKSLNLEKNVIFCGVCSNVVDYLSAADLMIFPSLWEGLPVSLVEAQYADLRVICSTNISSEVLASSYIRALSLSKTAEKWADEIISFLSTNIPESAKSSLDCNGYNIKIESKKLLNIYKELAEKKNDR